MADVSSATLRSFELGQRTPNRNNLSAIRRALEGAGIEFIGGDRPGVRFATPRHLKEIDSDGP